MRRCSRRRKSTLLLHRSKRGVSYIMSVLAMILVTASLAGMVLLWGTNVIGESNLSFSSAIDAKYARWQENLVIEDVEFINSTAINVHLRNAGSSLLVVDTVYVNYDATTSDRLTLSWQENGNVTATVGFTLEEGETYHILVVTTRGTKVSGDFTNS
ncbi:MAG: hypothetical protein ACE5KU_00205 [Nitrososphaerales archaeon]